MIAASLALLVQQGAEPYRFDFLDRLQRLEVAWPTAAPAARKQAIAYRKQAMAAASASEGCQLLDRALAAAEGRGPRAADAISLRFAKPFAEPGGRMDLSVSWSYRPTSGGPVVVQSCGKTVRLAIGRSATLRVNPWDVNAELRQNPEIGTLVPVAIAGETRYVYVNYVRNYAARIAALRKSQSQFVAETGAQLAKTLEDPHAHAADVPLIQAMFQAEALRDGKARLVDLEQVVHARSGATSLRAQFPSELRGAAGVPATVVIAIPVRGGDENVFFQSRSRSRALTDALLRGWAFVSVPPGERSVADAVAWLTQVRKLKLDRVFVLSQEANPKPSAAVSAYALLNPSSAFSGKVFVARDAESSGEGKRYPGSDEIMLLEDAVFDCYEFFARS